MAEYNQQEKEQEQYDPQFLQQIQSNPELMAKIQNDPTLLRQLYQDYQGLGEINADQMAQADALRGEAAPEGLQAGGQFVAASPWEHLANAGNRGMGQMQYQQALQAKKDLSGDKTGGLTSVVQSMNAPQQSVDPRAEAIRKLGLMNQNQNAQFSS